MFCVASLVPSPPVLIPELGGAAGASAEGAVAALRAAVLRAGEALAGPVTRWVVVGAADGNRLVGSDSVGSFRGYGVDVQVSLAAATGNGVLRHSDAAGPAAADPRGGVAVADPTLPLPVLIGGWLRARVAPEVTAHGRLIAADATADECLTFGRRLRAELDADPEPYGVLVVGDGAATLSISSPGYFDERAEGVQAQIDRALTAGDRGALAALDIGLCAELSVAGRAAYQVLAGLFAADAADPEVETGYAAAPFGVAYHVSVWRPGAAR
ncbi:hypothetical protein H0264_30860 [Nocardia huaxiensis]|uniref:Uncharacterized protein n=1 Tax=Nocardia huaxiensis TaxID=2755382 RepID=A0A7D6Z2X8_9NOCA|nr:hypothetical protein [Nocardia huaxiensis]QLY29604.1 hypothetical protein H0264_30860 [Nocardia huaxiensis]